MAESGRDAIARAALVRETAPVCQPGKPAADAAELFGAFADDPYPFFLDSGLRGGEQGRYSFMGSRPFLVIGSKDGWVFDEVEGGRRTRRPGRAFRLLEQTLARFRLTSERGGKAPFLGGAVGFLGYDLVHELERLPRTARDDVGFPDMQFGLYDAVAAFDHAESRCFLAANACGGRDPERLLDELEERVASGARPRPAAPRGVAGPITSNFAKADYLAAVYRAIEYIAAGDIFQVNLSQRFHARFDGAPWELYRRLRTVNPAPFSAYLGLGEGMAIASASPERFLRMRGRAVQTCPIKGTRPRGRAAEEDEALRRELLSSDKDGAELAMIVDLERNDLGRVCEYGSVEVTRPRSLESFPTVHHLAATVEGRLHERFSPVDLLRATFPGGSITGAPKIRAMEIIDELEPTARAAYTGGLGYIGFDGTMDLNIVIRTFLTRKQDIFFQAGGGIVADSDPEMEYEETLHKARALMEAIRRT